MKKIKIFVSYKRTVLEDILNSLVNELKGAITGSYLIEEVIVDKSIHISASVFDKIKNCINSSHVFIAFITPEYLGDSLETIDEFVYAHTILKPVIYLRHEKVTNTNFHYLNDANYINFCSDSKIHEIVVEIKNRIDQLQYSEMQFPLKIVEMIDSVRNHIDAETPEFRRKMAFAELNNSFAEIKSILTQDNYKIDIGLQKNYLYRAIPMFECAKKIYAISKYDVSDFWTSQSEVILRDYIDAHSKAQCVYRIFVFENARQLNEYKDIIHYQFISYGSKGGVFFTSIETYNSLFRDVSGFDKGDFGMLFYDDVVVKAQLNSNELSFQYASEFESRIVSEIFESRIKRNNRIIKWGKDIHYNHSLLAKEMYKLFSNSQKRIKHLVLFYINPESKSDFDRWVIDFKSSMESTAKWESVSILSKYSKLARDHQYIGVLKVYRSNYALVFEFRNKEDLEKYYSNETHSKYREKLYKILNPSSQSYYNLLRPCLSCEICKSECRKGKEDLYEQIENDMRDYIQRIDFIDDEPMESIVNNNTEKKIVFQKPISRKKKK